VCHLEVAATIMAGRLTRSVFYYLVGWFFCPFVSRIPCIQLKLSVISSSLTGELTRSVSKYVANGIFHGELKSTAMRVFARTGAAVRLFAVRWCHIILCDILYSFFWPVPLIIVNAEPIQVFHDDPSREGIEQALQKLWLSQIDHLVCDCVKKNVQPVVACSFCFRAQCFAKIGVVVY